MWYFKPKQITRVHFEISNYCNAACPECPRADPNEINHSTGKNRFDELGWIDTHFLPLDLIKKTFNRKNTPALQELSFCGCLGDALTHPNFLEILEYFITEYPMCTIYIHTNGGLKTKAYWSKLGKILSKAYYHEVIWGLDGLEDTNHIYRVNVNWKKVMENVDAFHAAGGISMWQFIVFPHNYHQIEEARQMAKNKGFATFKKVLSFRYADEKDLPEEFKHAIAKKDIDETEETILVAGQPNGPQPPFFDYSKSFQTIDKNTGKLLICESQDKHLVFVFSEGTIWPCSQLGFRHSTDKKHRHDYCISREWEDNLQARYKNNLHFFNIQEIMENEWWSTVHQSHKAGDACKACASQCGVMPSKKDKYFFEAVDINYIEAL